MPASANFPGLVAVMPALDEEGSVGAVVAGLLGRGVAAVVVGDNGSRDRTAAVAASAGATVVHEPRRGYGSACLAALAHVPRDARAVLFCDADGSDDLDRIAAVAGPVLDGGCDLVIGSRALGRRDPGSVTQAQHVGNWCASTLMRVLYGVRVTDLGPFRCVSMEALRRLRMADAAYGWTCEMQVKAYRLGLRVREVPVDALARTAGRSKISGRVGPAIRASWTITRTILRWHDARLPG